MNIIVKMFKVKVDKTLQIIKNNFNWSQRSVIYL